MLKELVVCFLLFSHIFIYAQSALMEQLRIFMNGDHRITPCVSIVVASIFKENGYACTCCTN